MKLLTKRNILSMYRRIYKPAPRTFEPRFSLFFMRSIVLIGYRLITADFGSTDGKRKKNEGFWPISPELLKININIYKFLKSALKFASIDIKRFDYFENFLTFNVCCRSNAKIHQFPFHFLVNIDMDWNEKSSIGLRKSGFYGHLNQYIARKKHKTYP